MTPEQRLRQVLGEMRYHELYGEGSILISSGLCPGRVYSLERSGFVYFTDPCDPNNKLSWLCIITYDADGKERDIGSPEDIRLKYLLLVCDELRFVAVANVHDVGPRHWAKRYKLLAKRRLNELSRGAAPDPRPLGRLTERGVIYQV